MHAPSQAISASGGERTPWTRAYANSEVVMEIEFARAGVEEMDPAGKRRGICVERKCASVFDIPR
jgi:hypothetical protein